MAVCEVCGNDYSGSFEIHTHKRFSIGGVFLI